jgi:hypothetical protein
MKYASCIFALPLLLAASAAEQVGVAAPNRQSGSVFDVTAYGAVDDPKVSSTDAFRRATAACREAGGGTVRVPAGHFLTGPLDLVDNMTLQVDRGAVVLFDTRRASYPDISSRWEGLTQDGPHPLIFASGLRNVAITGEGTLDGQGAAWWATMDMAEHGNARPARPTRRRPMFIQSEGSAPTRATPSRNRADLRGRSGTPESPIPFRRWPRCRGNGGSRW